MYPRTLTGIFASSHGNTIRKNAILLPAYTLLLGLLAQAVNIVVAVVVNLALPARRKLAEPVKAGAPT